MPGGTGFGQGANFDTDRPRKSRVLIAITVITTTSCSRLDLVR